MMQYQMINIRQRRILHYVVILITLIALCVPSVCFAQTWIARYDRPGNGYDATTAIAVDDASNVYVTGYSVGLLFTNDYATVKYDSSGNELWVARYNGPGNHWDIADAIILDNAGNIYVTGYSVSSGINFDYATIKYAPTGVQEDSESKIHDSRYSLMVCPNPFHDRTDIRYQITDTSRNVDLIIYDVTGRIVKSFRIIPSGRRGLSSQRDGTPYSATQYGGLRNTLSWDGTDNAGRKLPSGIYFVTCRSGDNQETEKLLLIR